MQNIELLGTFTNNPGIIEDPFEFAELKRKTSNARMKSTQDPEELRRFLLHLKNISLNINDYFEVGCSGGGTFYFVTSFMKSVNNYFDLAIANDIRNKVRKFGEFKAYMSLNDVEVNFLCANSHTMEIEKKYDLVFIDANHTFNGVLTDYVKWKDHARYLAFHDVAYRGEKRMCGVPSAWMLIKQNYTDVKEFVNPNSVYSYPQGIGIIDTHSNIINEARDNIYGEWWNRYGITV